MLKGYGERNTSRIAIAPTKSTSFIMGNPSLCVEPIKSNYHIKDLAKIFSEYRNPELEKLLEEKGHNTTDVWDNILKMNGSVQHLFFLNEEEKALFMTFEEISPMDVIKLAAQRQQFIDQSQSINLMIPNSASPKEIINLTIEAWKLGIKTLYYHYTVNAAQNARKSILTCTSCEG
jgi:ribonucleoside-diphosphate reductase alpha chain